MKAAAKSVSPITASELAPVELLVVQPTPFCNLDCDYCYLPDRDSTAKMPLQVLEAAVQRVSESGLAGDGFSVVWHAGEPMVPGVRYYREAFERIEDLIPAGLNIRHSIQTNATLVNDAWCDLFREYRVNVGVSVDGPEFIHDIHRKDRKGKGSHAMVQAGMDRLRKHGIDYHTISVLTAEALEHPQALYRYFVDNEIQRCGFNMEEVENVNLESTLAGPDSKRRVIEFLSRFYDLVEEGGYQLHVRELKGAMAATLGWDPSRDSLKWKPQELMPFRILNVDVQGFFSTYSPELLGTSIPPFGKFAFGNVLQGPLLSVLDNPYFLATHAAIQAGVERCRASCEYFEFCGGGAPSNKYFENGSFDSSETNFCRMHYQAPIDVVLAKLEIRLGI